MIRRGKVDNNNFQRVQEGSSLKDYLFLIRNNLVPIILITLAGLAVAVIYAINAPNIYKATTSLKVSKPQGSILESPLIPEFQDFGSDRFIANEIEILKSYSVRERVANAMLSYYKDSSIKDSFYIIKNKDYGKDRTVKSPVKSVQQITDMLTSVVSIDQKRGLDIVEISVESQSPYEAALLANEYATAYNQMNLQTNRAQLTNIKNFLEEQRKGKQGELSRSEDSLRRYQQQGGIIALDEQAKSLIDQLTNFEAQKNSTNIELTVARNNLAQYRDELKKQDPRLADYLQSFAAEPYLKSLQEEIAKLETNRDIALASKGQYTSNSKVIADYEAKIKSLKDKVTEKMSVYKAGIFASSPEEVKSLTQKIIEEETKVKAATASLQELNDVVRSYDAKFNSLPKATIELAKLERDRTANEKMYLLVEEKYQEAIINEQSQPGNVLIIDYARIPYKPAKPNRMLIVIVGFIFGLGMGLGYAFIKNYFDNTIKTPDDIENRNINVLAWIPTIEGLGQNGNSDYEFIVAKKPDSIPSEAYRALRTRVQFSKLEKDAIKSVLITSSTPQEGKTITAVNLAGSFAQANKKTLLLDCDLRKPRLHAVFKNNRYPGFTDYFFGQATYSEIIRPSGTNNLYIITAGTIPPNPSELLGSHQMLEFMEKLRREFDIIIIDSAPVIAVTDSEIISRIVDATILVVSSNITEVDVMEKSVNLLKHEQKTFIGVLLNNFTFRSSYGSYYKYYYYYSRPNENGRKKSKKLDSV
ncbi:MAG: polysaccharide biosynthesis tyrosine autokinase [Ignavibacteriales bacterium]|nr:MAG: polysaccharide biosynthesis tyrosine autokinase [Ignavibacteriales bacterium]